MKTILYVGATLMIGASIYGFVDYKKTSRNSAFTKMYESKETKPVITHDQIKEVVTKPEVTTKDKVVAVKKEATKKNQVAGEKLLTKKDMQPIETIIEEKVATDPLLKENPAGKIEKPAKTQKKFSTKLFSRAALDEKYISKELKLEPAKEGPKGKNVTSSDKNKEQ